jgi:hypothetical protein
MRDASLVMLLDIPSQPPTFGRRRNQAGRYGATSEDVARLTSLRGVPIERSMPWTQRDLSERMLGG